MAITNDPKIAWGENRFKVFAICHESSSNAVTNIGTITFFGYK